MIENLFEKAPCGYFSFLEDGTIFLVNETLCSTLGYDKEALQGKNVEILFTLSTRIFYQTHFSPLLKMHGHAEEIFITLLTKSGEHLPVLLNAKFEPAETPITSCVFIVVHNRNKFESELIAARKAAEKALAENSSLMIARDELQEQAEKLDEQIHIVEKQNRELQQFNHAVTHNLREPIRKILLYLDKMTTTDLVQEKIMNKLKKASVQMITIVSDLQQYVWLNETHNNFADTDLDSLIAAVQEELNKDYPGILLLEMAKLPPIQADSAQMRILFYHVLLNAVKFRKGDAAKVTITGAVIKKNRFRYSAGKYLYDDHLKIDIRDEGIGFDPSYVEMVFELFKRMHYTSGQGLGLALCRKITDNHRGFISAESKPDEFTVITILLPLVQRGMAAEELPPG